MSSSVMLASTDVPYARLLGTAAHTGPLGTEFATPRVAGSTSRENTIGEHCLQPVGQHADAFVQHSNGNHPCRDHPIDKDLDESHARQSAITT